MIGGVFHRCGYTRSQMRWRVRAWKGDTGTVHLIKFPGERVDAVCGDGTEFFLCVPDYDRDLLNALRVSQRGG